MTRDKKMFLSFCIASWLVLSPIMSYVMHRVIVGSKYIDIGHPELLGVHGGFTAVSRTSVYLEAIMYGVGITTVYIAIALAIGMLGMSKSESTSLQKTEFPE